MLDTFIRACLRHRPLVLAVSILLLVLGWRTVVNLPVEVLPDLTKPTVTILTEAPGLAPEEVETLVTQPVESAVQGVSGVDRLRSSSDVGLSLVFVEFGWGTDIYRARQLVNERLQTVLQTLPAQAETGLTPVSSLMGEILLVGVRCDKKPGEDGYIDPVSLRTLADWTIRRRLQSIRGVAEVLVIGGGVQQIHVQPLPPKMAAFGVSVADLEAAVGAAAGNATSGYLQTGAQEVMVRNVAMTTDLDELGRTVIKTVEQRPVLLSDVATLVHGVQPMRGDASVNGTRGVILSIDKSPGFDTLKVTAAVEQALAEMRPGLPASVHVESLFRQGDFIQRAIGNLNEAIRDGAVMVAIVLLLFLLNVRTTAITLTAIPLSFAVTVLIFRWFDVTVNSMTLGGLAVAIGMVVDDAIVDVENVYRRLQQNASRAQPLPRLEVIARASAEVRNSILYATVLIMLAFVPLLGLQGIEGRLFTPIAIATITSMAASFLVSLTIIPVLCSFVVKPRSATHHADGWLVRMLKGLVRHTCLRLARSQPLLILAVTSALLIAAGMLYPRMGQEFLPAFNEGSATISLVSPPGTSLRQSNEVGEVAVRLLQGIPEIKSIGRRAGRAERDDHVMPVSVNELDVEFIEEGRARDQVLADIRQRLATIPGTYAALGQPISHRLSHMLSGVSAKIAVKVVGPDLDQLRFMGAQIEAIGQNIPGLADVMMEAQVPIPQLKIAVDRDRALQYGMQPGAVNEQVSTLIGGKTLAELREGPRTVDLLLRLPEEQRQDAESLRSLLLEVGNGRRLPLALLADVRESRGPNVINRENAQRRVVISANTSERDLGNLVQRFEAAVREQLQIPPGYFISFEGEFQAQEAATRQILLLSSAIFLVIVLLLSGYFRSLWLSLQVLINIPLALMGGVALTWLLVDNISIATLVGFIAVAGVAARNGIMMISHYLHLMRDEGLPFDWEMVERGTLERLVPVLMTALSAGIALVPLVLSVGEPGKEILHPIAVVIVGGLVSSTLLDLLVTPAVFYHFGKGAAVKALKNKAAASN